jgi:hypothetical protein
MSIETPNRCQPEQTIYQVSDLARQVQRMRLSMGVASVCEEMDLPRQTVLMLARFSR